jgi:small subunit ribosomal protein S8
MSMSDPLADLLTRIRNAQMAGHESVEVPHSRLKAAVAAILLQEGYIAACDEEGEGVARKLRITLKYDEDRKGIITGIARVSRPSRRIYVKSGNIPKVMSGFGVGIISTSAGLLTDRDARSRGVGGEFLCKVW